MLTELTKAEIQEVLTNNYIGRIGCRDGDRIYIFPVNYVHQHDMVYCQSYEGAKVAMMRAQPNVCFEVEEIRDFYHWKTAMGWGTFEELTSAEDIQEVKLQLSEIMLARKASLTALPPTEASLGMHGTLSAIVYYRIRFTELSGRSEKNI
jgi:nitroimidazol reductase NimA-like FMN-containing flavoprotein (pyridoxamine 5'-phosphate oxidase superfamily)